MAIHENTQTLIHDIPVKNEVKYLGVNISRSLIDREITNIETVMQRNQKILNSLLQRNISVFGRLLLTKMEGISRLIYPEYSLAVPDECFKKIIKIHDHFI